jgi:hypothetical protein
VHARCLWSETELTPERKFLEVNCFRLSVTLPRRRPFEGEQTLRLIGLCIPEDYIRAPLPGTTEQRIDMSPRYWVRSVFGT